MRTTYLAVTINIMVFPLVANAQEAGDPREGLQFARANCTACHAVNSSDEKSPNPNATLAKAGAFGLGDFSSELFTA